MPSQVTVTAKTGPAVQNTSAIFKNLTSISLDLDRKVIQLIQDKQVIKEFDLHGVTTLTDSISSDVHTLVIS